METAECLTAALDRVETEELHSRSSSRSSSCRRSSSSCNSSSSSMFMAFPLSGHAVQGRYYDQTAHIRGGVGSVSLGSTTAPIPLPNCHPGPREHTDNTYLHSPSFAIQDIDTSYHAPQTSSHMPWQTPERAPVLRRLAQTPHHMKETVHHADNTPYQPEFY